MNNVIFLNRVVLMFGRGAIATTLGVVWLMVATPTWAAPSQVVRGEVPAAVANHSLQPLQRLAATNQLNLAIGLPTRNADALTSLLDQLYDPASTNFHQFLSTEEFTASFGPSEQDYQAVIDFADAHGLTVTTTYPNRMIVDVSASVVEIEAAFHIALGVYQHPTENRNFYAPDIEPSLDLAVPILNISGLDNFSLPRPRFKATPLAEGQAAAPQSGSGTGGTYMGNDFRAPYAPGGPLGRRGKPRRPSPAPGRAAPIGGTISGRLTCRGHRSPARDRPWACWSLTATTPATSPITKPKPGCRALRCRMSC